MGRYIALITLSLFLLTSLSSSFIQQIFAAELSKYQPDGQIILKTEPKRAKLLVIAVRRADPPGFTHVFLFKDKGGGEYDSEELDRSALGEDGTCAAGNDMLLWDLYAYDPKDKAAVDKAIKDNKAPDGKNIEPLGTKGGVKAGCGEVTRTTMKVQAAGGGGEKSKTCSFEGKLQWTDKNDGNKKKPIIGTKTHFSLTNKKGDKLEPPDITLDSKGNWKALNIPAGAWTLEAIYTYVGQGGTKQIDIKEEISCKAGEYLRNRNFGGKTHDEVVQEGYELDYKDQDLPSPPEPPCKDFDASGKCTYVWTAFGALSTDPAGFVVKIFAVILSISGGIAVLLIMKAGYQIMTSQGKPQSLQEGREQLIAAIVGLLFIIFSFVFLQVIGIDILQIPQDTATIGGTPIQGKPGNKTAGQPCTTKMNDILAGCSPGLFCLANPDQQKLKQCSEYGDCKGTCGTLGKKAGQACKTTKLGDIQGDCEPNLSCNPNPGELKYKLCRDYGECKGTCENP